MLVKNMWKRTTVICDEDGSEFKLKQVNNYVFYQCPSCGLSLDITDYEKVVDRVCELESDRQQNNVDVCYDGIRFKKGSFIYTVEKDGGEGGQWKVSARSLR